MNLEQIIDGLDDRWSPATDEHMIRATPSVGTYTRTFSNTKTKEYLDVFWDVYYGTPETVKTVFTSQKIYTKENIA